jgi:flagellar protein FliT
MATARETGSPEAIVEGYQALLGYTQRMLHAAREADWPALIEEEHDYVQAVEAIARLDAEQVLNEAQRQRKAELLETILENDLEIRQRLIQRREELSTLIGNAQRQRDVERAYGTQPPSTPGPAT